MHKVTALRVSCRGGFLSWHGFIREKADFSEQIGSADGWYYGSICKANSFLQAEASILPLMRRTITVPVSIVGLTGICFIPFLINRLFGFISKLWILVLNCYIEPFS